MFHHAHGIFKARLILANPVGNLVGLISAKRYPFGCAHHCGQDFSDGLSL